MTKTEGLTKVEFKMPDGGWDDGEYESKDLLLPMICVAQSNSEVVKNDMAKIGDIYETVNKTVLGGAKSSFNFIPIKFYKTWIHCEVVGARPEFRSVEPYNASNSTKYEWEETKQDGTKWRHYETLNFYVLLEKDLIAKQPFPYLLSFRSTNKKKGRALINHMALAKGMIPPKPLCSKMFAIKTVVATKGRDSWSVFDVMPVEETKPEYVQQCLSWLDALKHTAHKIDESGFKEASDEAEAIEVDDVPTKKANSKVEKEARY